MTSCSCITTALVFGISLMLIACEESTSVRQDENGYAQGGGVVPKSAQQKTIIQSEVGVKALTTDEYTESKAKFDSELTEQTPAGNDPETSTAAERKIALVEGMGFSTDTITELDATEQASEKRFCLRNETKQIKLTSEQACDRISNRLASVSGKSCNAANLQASTCESVGGFPIFLREFPPLGDRKPQGKILVVGGIHGDELTSVSVVFRWIAKLNKYHSGLFHWHVVPMMNPDGVLQRAAQRTNKNGVDLNRNLPSEDWEENALRYWRDKQGENPRRYPGEQPASEPETQWLIDEINDFRPDAIISVHAPYGVVDFDALLLNTAPKSLGKLHLNLLGTYPGSLGNYAGINRDIPVITLELPHAWEMPSEQETTKIWEDIVGWLRKNINAEVAGNTQ